LEQSHNVFVGRRREALRLPIDVPAARLSGTTLEQLEQAALAAPFTVNTMPEDTLKALAKHGVIEATMPEDGGDCEEVLARFAGAGIDVHALSAQLQAHLPFRGLSLHQRAFF
jgi:hypothetical protein